VKVKLTDAIFYTFLICYCTLENMHPYTPAGLIWNIFYRKGAGYCQYIWENSCSMLMPVG